MPPPAIKRPKSGRRQNQTGEAPAGPGTAELQHLVALYSAGNLKEAERLGRQLARQFPKAFIVFNILGNIRATQGKLAQAVASYRQAIRINANFPEAFNNLGRALEDLGKRRDAVESYRRAISLKPDYANAHNNLGNALTEFGDYAAAVLSYQRALKSAPNDAPALFNFALSLGNLRLSGEIEVDDHFKSLLIRCFEKPDIESEILNSASQSIIREALRAAAGDLDPEASIGELGGLDKRLLIAQLRYSRVTDIDLEVFLTALRRQWLLRYDECAAAQRAVELSLDWLAALAHQGYLNEYVWYVSDQETAALERLQRNVVTGLDAGRAVSHGAIYLLAAYTFLGGMAAFRRCDAAVFGQGDRRLTEMLILQVANVLEEERIAAGLAKITEVDDVTSKAVQAQYEDNPYPRWHSVTVQQPIPYVEKVLLDVAPHRPALEATAERPKILVAGGGTGKQPIQAALCYDRSDVLAIDLSKASLAYAARKAREMDVGNIRFGQADILRLGAIDERFDVIVCSGVLHHLRNPEAGLKVLVSLLKPDGLMKIALYSALARQNVVGLRALIAEEKFPSNPDGIRAFRKFVRQHPTPDAAALLQSHDFYATSNVRDLLFHVQEHRFTIPELSDLMVRNNLQFLGFQFTSPKTKSLYRQAFPKDRRCIDLASWHEFEQQRPQTFAGMYQFWCRKPV